LLTIVAGAAGAEKISVFHERKFFMMQELLLMTGLTGLTLIIVRGAVFHDVRDWLLLLRPDDLGYLLTCPQCMGFWIGLLGGAVYADFLTAPLYAGAVSLLAMVTDKWMQRHYQQF
jgi:hypothetical protein